MSNGQTGHTALEAVHVCVLLRSIGPGLWSALPLKLEHAGREIPKRAERILAACQRLQGCGPEILTAIIDRALTKDEARRIVRSA